MTFNPLTHIRYYIYLLQLENYNLPRFLSVSGKSLFHARKTLRLGITWTTKLRLIVFAAGLLGALIITIPFLIPSLELVVQGLLAVILFLGVSFFFHVLLGLVVFFTFPLDIFLKRRIVDKARAKLEARASDLIVIGITGSYGKTTMKEVIAASLSGKFTVLKTEENKNTPLGIARQVLNDLSRDTDVYVVEMGAYKRGDIKELVELVQPSIVVLVGINEAHLQRQGSMENIIETKFEIVKHAPEGTFVVLNHDDERVRENAGRFIRKDQEVVWFGKDEGDVTATDIAPQDDGTIGFRLVGEGEYGVFTSQFLASYIAVDAAAALLIADKLGVPVGSVRAAISQVRPVPHRLDQHTRDGILFIDDAYNGNPDGVAEALQVLNRFKGRRKICITPGLVEMAERTEDVHKKIGRDLARTADIVVLIENEATRIIKEALVSQGFPQENIHMFARASEAHGALKTMLKRGDVVLFQNDAAENYL